MDSSELLVNLYAKINEVRKNNQASSCIVDQILVEATTKHAMDMAKNNFVSHIGSDGSTYITRVRSFGATKDPSGEIICKGPGGVNCVEAVVNAWLDSPGHREIMLDPYNCYFGAACHLKTSDMPGNYWVVEFSYTKLSFNKLPITKPIILEEN